MPSLNAVSSRSSDMPSPSSTTSMTRGVGQRARRGCVMRAAADLARQPVLDAVFDQRLQDHARHEDVERVAGRSAFCTRSCGPKRITSMSRYSSIGVELLAQRDELLLARAAAGGAAPTAAGSTIARRLGLRADQRRDRGQRVEQEVRVDLARERRDLGRQQQLLLLLQPVLDARVVPDLDRRRHAEHRGDVARARTATPRARRGRTGGSRRSARRRPGGSARGAMGASSSTTCQSTWNRRTMCQMRRGRPRRRTARSARWLPSGTARAGRRRQTRSRRRRAARPIRRRRARAPR